MQPRRQSFPPIVPTAGMVILVLLFLSSMWPSSVYPAPDAPTPTPTPTPPPPPELLSPESGATTTGLTDPPLGVPRLRWAAVPGATRYHIQISSAEGFASILEENDTYATEYTPYKRGYADGIYYWHVKSGNKTQWGNYSPAWSFNKDWTAAGSLRPNLLTPANNAILNSFSEFTWSPMLGAAQYLLEIDADPAFPSPVDYSVTTVKPAHTPTRKLGNNIYYWRVTPLDRSGNRGVPSDTMQFRLNWNERPRLLSPEDNTTVLFTPEFRWTAVAEAKYYILDISTDDRFSTLVRHYEPRNTSFTPDRALANDQDLYWRVQAVDSVGNKGPVSETRKVRIKWSLKPELLAPTDNWTTGPHPVFMWSPVPGAKQYRIQVAESRNFGTSIKVDKLTAATSYTHGDWGEIKLDPYFWQVRAEDNQGNHSEWSEVRSFKFGVYSASGLAPNLIYPPYYYEPDTERTPVHSDPTIAAPLFIWDTSHDERGPVPYLPADYYVLEVNADPSFRTRPNFAITTTTQAAAPTVANPFTGLIDGQVYYWRVRAYRNGQQMGTDTVWKTRIDTRLPLIPITDTIALMYPPDGHEVVVDAPVLGWQPVRGATQYRVQISRNEQFTAIVDEQLPTFLNYVPFQGRIERLSNGTYYWRVRVEQPNVGIWSEVRHFNLSHRVLTINPLYDYPWPPTTPISNDPANLVASSPNEGLGSYELQNLYVALERNSIAQNYYWVIVLDSQPTSDAEIHYGVYFDTDHLVGSGASQSPLCQWHNVNCNIQIRNPLYRPDFALYVHRLTGGQPLPELYRWSGEQWTANIWPDEARADLSGGVLQIRIPITALGTGDEAWVGSLAMEVFTLSPDLESVRDTIPEDATPLSRFAFTSDLLNPIYPFDTPGTNPIILFDNPLFRWLMPYWDTVDGYRLQIARDRAFTDLVAEGAFEAYESKEGSAYSFVPTAFAPTTALKDNETYYWRVQTRHEKWESSRFDYGPYSYPFRFKLDSRRPANLYVSPSNPVYTTPTFHWDRVEGVGVYRLQVDDDENFSSPIINLDVDLTSYTPLDTFADGTYYWRVAIKRDNNNYGKWTATQTFTQVSPAPEPISPRNGEAINGLPTFRWQPVLIPGEEPRRATPRYRLVIDDDPNFSSPLPTVDTDATSYTPRKGEKYKDGTWYWKVAMLDASNRPGPFSLPQSFYKEYVPPTVVSPPQGSSTPGIPTFIWQPLDGAAQYKLQLDDNEFFSSPESYMTDNTVYTPVTNLSKGVYFWRVQMVDVDGQPGPFTVGRVRIGHRIFLPALLRNVGKPRY